MNGGEARLSRRLFPIITGWGEVVPPVASVLRAHHVVLMHSESRRRRQGVGPARVEAVGRPRSPALPPLLLEERGGRVPTPPLYKERKGATEIRTPSPSSFCFWFPSPIRDGGGGTLVLLGLPGGCRLGNAPLLPLRPRRRSRSSGEEGEGEVADEVVDGAEALGADGSVGRPPLCQRLRSFPRSISGTTPVSSLSGCAGRLVAASGFPLHSRACWRWSSLRR